MQIKQFITITITSSPHFSSGTVEQVPFSRGVIFMRARVLLALIYLRKNGDHS